MQVMLEIIDELEDRSKAGDGLAAKALKLIRDRNQQIWELLTENEKLNDVYLEVKAKWNKLRVKPEADEDILRFLIKLMEMIEEDVRHDPVHGS